MSPGAELEDGGQHPTMTGRRWQSHQFQPTGYWYPRLQPWLQYNLSVWTA